MSSFLKLTPKDIAFLIKIIEGYDNLAIVKTIDGKKGIVQLIYPASLSSEVDWIVENFPRPIEKIPPGDY